MGLVVIIVAAFTILGVAALGLVLAQKGATPTATAASTVYIASVKQEVSALPARALVTQIAQATGSETSPLILQANVDAQSGSPMTTVPQAPPAAAAAPNVRDQSPSTISKAMVHETARLKSREMHEGQIYIPRANSALLIGVLLLVAIFHTSDALASAYGVAVTTTMVVDGVLGFIVIWKAWGWRPWAAAIMMVPLISVDAIFLSSNLLKIVEGAWAPLALGAAIVLLVLTWRRGTMLLLLKTRQNEVPLDKLITSLEKKPPHVVPGTAVFLTSDPSSAPTALLHNLKHNKILHEHNVILTIKTADTPRVPDDDRVHITQVSRLFAKVGIAFGFMETPNIPKALAIARKRG